MSSSPTQNRISRRRMLKRIGAGAAVAWSAPVLSSLRTPAFAQYDRCPAPCDFVCGGPVQRCGEGAGGFICLCDDTGPAPNECFCLNDAPCQALVTCGAGGSCPAPFRCSFTNCCARPVCVPPCGVLPSRTARAEGDLTVSGLDY